MVIMIIGCIVAALLAMFFFAFMGVGIVFTIRNIRNPRPRVHNGGPRFSELFNEKTQSLYELTK